MHKRYVEKLCRKISSDYETVKQNVKLYRDSNYNERNLAGEIDVLACNGKTCDLYEVKCSHRIIKARLQMNRIRNSIDKEISVRHVFFYCGESDSIEKLSGNRTKNNNSERIKDIKMPPSIRGRY